MIVTITIKIKSDKNPKVFPYSVSKFNNYLVQE